MSSKTFRSSDPPSPRNAKAAGISAACEIANIRKKDELMRFQPIVANSKVHNDRYA